MTALGKTLVFFNLLFALVTGGLIVQVFLTRTNWKIGFEAAVADRNAAQAVAKSEKVLADQRARAFDADRKKLEDEIVNLKKEVAGRIEEARDHKAAREAAVTAQREAIVNSQAASQEIDKLKTERNQMQVQLAQKNDRVARLESDLANLSAKEKYASIRADITEKEIEEKKVELANLNRQIGELRAELQSLGALKSKVAGMKPRVPTVEQVGKVTSVADNLAVISLGSDHGLEVGHILQVYRTVPSAQYLGTLTINKTETHRAVGLFQPSGRNVVKVGDTVDTKIIR
jgi:prefoldin subunit 5